MKLKHTLFYLLLMALTSILGAIGADAETRARADAFFAVWK